MNKKCFKCKQLLPLDNFKRHSGRADGLQPDCITCQAKYRKEHYLKNKKDYLDRAFKRNKIVRKLQQQKIWDLKKSCSICGETHPACLDFHHRDPSNKEFSISQAIGNKGWDTLLKEIEKCDVICSNCHRKLHWQGY